MPMQFRKFTFCDRALSKIGCEGFCTSYCFQKLAQMSPSLCKFGCSNPENIWLQLFWIRNSIQLRTRRNGICVSNFVSKKLCGIGKDKWKRLTINRWQSLSPLLGLFLDKSKRPPAFATASSPTSATTSLAVRTAAAQGAWAILGDRRAFTINTFNDDVWSVNLFTV